MRHYSPRTEDAYVHWIKRYIFFYKLRHPAEMGRDEVSGFLTHLAVDERLSASTQNQAFNALLFLYKVVLGRDVGPIHEVVRADRPRRSGLRLLEALRMRVKDFDFLRLEIMVRDGKGGKDRVTMLPATCRDLHARPEPGWNGGPESDRSPVTTPLLQPRRNAGDRPTGRVRPSHRCLW